MGSARRSASSTSSLSGLVRDRVRVRVRVRNRDRGSSRVRGMG